MVKGNFRSSVVRAILLTSGFGAGFCVLWFLLANMQAVLADYRTSQPVLGVLQGETIQQIQQGIQFPLQVPGTCLVAEQIVAYEGPFLEDGSQREVVNVAALLLRNTAEYGIESAEVALRAGQVSFVFEANTIPAGQAVLVLEREGKGYGPNVFSGCSGWAVCSMEDWSGAGALEIQNVDMGTVTVTNLTDKVHTNIRLHYKNFLADPGFLVGGHTYVHTLDRLEPGQAMRIILNNYANGYSQFVRIELAEGA